MKNRGGLLLGCAAGALVIGLGSLSQALAADGNSVSSSIIDSDWIASALAAYATYQTPVNAAPPLAVKAAPPVAPAWWFQGYVETGGRFFVNDPSRDGLAYLNQDSLAKYYEYSTDKPGPFLNGHVAAGSSDGLYRVDLWSENVGYSDQSYDLSASKAGESYVDVQWDQTPHIYSTSAQTIYNGVGTNALTLPAGLSNKLFTDVGCLGVVGGFPVAGTGSCASSSATNVPAANAALVAQDIQQNLHGTDIGIRRDTASAEYRWTPSDWDVRANYSDMHRFGTQVQGVVFSASTSGVAAQVPAPVDDTTQNFGLSSEYVGTSPWSQRFNLKLSYGGSLYTDNINGYTVQNPFCPAAAVALGAAGGNECAITSASHTATSSPLALLSTWPDNQANMFGATVGADLPFKSRYMGTVSYDMMRQNQAFLPFTITSNFIGGPTPGLPLDWKGSTAFPANSTAALPAASLNGAINTLLVNNVLTTDITPDLKSKASYRYYDYDNGTPTLYFADWVQNDAVAASAANHAPVQTISPGYIKQNAGEELTYHIAQWDVGAAYGYERYNWAFADVDATNENSGKVYSDWEATSWATLRGSLSYAERRYENYNYAAYVGAFQWPLGTAAGGTGAGNYAAADRQFYLDNRNRTQAKFQTDVDLIPTFTVSPTFGLKNDDYNLNLATEQGVESDHSWNAGVDVAYAIDPDTHLLVSYLYEHHNQVVINATGNPPFTAAGYAQAAVQDVMHTVTVAANHTFVPNKFDVRVSYTVSLADDSQPLYFATGCGPSSTFAAGACGPSTTGGQYPDVRSLFQRLEVLGKYKFDDDFVHRLGWKGQMTAQLGYRWERNSVQNWQADDMQPYMYSTFAAGGAANSVGYMTWLAYDNPNYNVQLVTAAINWIW
jgi:hypothetical protein